MFTTRVSLRHATILQIVMQTRPSANQSARTILVNLQNEVSFFFGIKLF